jgi:hypothetical protein
VLNHLSKLVHPNCGSVNNLLIRDEMQMHPSEFQPSYSNIQIRLIFIKLRILYVTYSTPSDCFELRVVN